MTIYSACNTFIQFEKLVYELTRWTLVTTEKLVTNNKLPLIVPLTVTFKPGSIRSEDCLGEFEKFYHLMCRQLVKNLTRPNKRHLRPFTIAFLDDPSTRFKGNRPTIFADHPQVAPHIHCVMIVHPNCNEKFLKLEPTFEALWQKLNRRNATLKASIDDVKQFQNLMLNFRANKSRNFFKASRLDRLLG